MGKGPFRHRQPSTPASLNRRLAPNVVATMNAGDSFGELGHMTDNARRTASIRTKEFTKVLNVGIDTLEALTPENQAMLYKGFLKSTMERLTSLMQSMENCQ